MRVMKILVVLALVTVPLTALAEEKETSRWTDQAELGYVSTSGNTSTSTLALRNDLGYSFADNIKGTWSLRVLNAETAGITTAERYFTEFRLDFGFSERLYGFGKANWLQDRPSGVDYRITAGVGAGYHFLTGPKHDLLGEAGFDYTDEKYTDDTGGNFLATRLFGKYGYNFNDKNRFTQSLEYAPDLGRLSNYRFNSETAFTSAISDIFSLKTAYVINYNNEPPAGFGKTDKVFSVTLVADFP